MKLRRNIFIALLLFPLIAYADPNSGPGMGMGLLIGYGVLGVLFLVGGGVLIGIFTVLIKLWLPGKKTDLDERPMEAAPEKAPQLTSHAENAAAVEDDPAEMSGGDQEPPVHNGGELDFMEKAAVTLVLGSVVWMLVMAVDAIP